jgi:RimJ/RimL family protein N-acetyltransferase
MSEQPTVETSRLILRPMAPSDAPDVQRLANDYEIAANTLRMPYPYENGIAEEWISRQQILFDDGKFATFAITLRDTGDFVGCISLELTPAHARAEIGYWLGKPYWGRGYCTEAARAVIRYGFERLGLRKIAGFHFARNPASGAVMRKAGMRREGLLRQHVKRCDRWEDQEVYGILREEYESGA